MEKTLKLSPNVKWAQRKDKLYITIEIRDIKNEKIDLQPTSLSFFGESDDKHYEFKIEFYDEINVEASKWSKFGFNLQFIIEKKNTDTKYWPRLLKENKKLQNIHVDWDKYVDEDDEAEEGQKGLGGGQWDPSAMQGFGGPGGFGGPNGFGGPGGFGPGGDDDDDDEDDKGGVDDLEGDEQLKEQKGHVHGQNCKHDHAHDHAHDHDKEVDKPKQ